MKASRFTFTLIAALAVLVLMGVLLRHPAPILAAAERGIAIWWDILFPALFPFFVISEMLLGFGIVHFFGTLLDPVMRPLFRVPGIGGFVMAMGFASGYPVAARLTAQLCDQKLVNREEGERLVAFSTTSDPIFLIGAVSVGFFHDPGLALILAVTHYGSAVLVGIAMRFHGGAARLTEPAPKSELSLVMRSLQAMHRARLKDGRPIGIMLNEAVRTSFRLIFIIGGLVVFFSVIMEALRIGQVMDLLYAMVNQVLKLFGVPAPLSEGVVNGLFEVTLGVKASAQAGAASIPLVDRLAVAAFVLSWAGLSVHAQIVSLLHHTGLRYTPFVVSRLLHGLLSSFAIIVLWKPLGEPYSTAVAAWASQLEHADPVRLMWSWSVPAEFGALLLVAAILTLLLPFLPPRRRMYDRSGKIR